MDLIGKIKQAETQAQRIIEQAKTQATEQAEKAHEVVIATYSEQDYYYGLKDYFAN